MKSVDRVWAKIDQRGPVPDGRPDLGACWLWTASRNHNNYGWCWWNGRARLAHRVVYEICREPIPEGFTIDHLCRNPQCVNPAHLEAVTQAENLLRGDTFQARNAAKTHCVRGHPFDAANTYVHVRKGREQRHCRACRSGVVA